MNKNQLNNNASPATTGHTLELHEYTAPSSWSSYLINGDASGLDADEKHGADRWIETLELGMPVSCDDAGFRGYHDAWPFSPCAGDCQTYSFLV